MKNMILLQKKNGENIYCRQISKKGIEFIKNSEKSSDEMDYNAFWEKGGTILLDELEEILDREI